MSSEEDEAQSPITGASGSKSQVSPMRSPADSDENAEFEEEDETPLKRGHKKDTREWMQIARFEVKDSEPEDIDHLIFTECKKLMEASLLFRLSVGSQEPNNIFLWRHSSFWDVANGSVRYQMLYCPMKGKFNCKCELKITDTSVSIDMCRTDTSVSIDMCGTHDENSHAPDKDTSKFMNVAQIEAIQDSEMPELISDDDDVEDPVRGPYGYVPEYGVNVNRNCSAAMKSWKHARFCVQLTCTVCTIVFFPR